MKMISNMNLNAGQTVTVNQWGFTIVNNKVVEDMKSPKEVYEIRKLVVSNLGTREDLLNFLFFYTCYLACNYIQKQ